MKIKLWQLEYEFDNDDAKIVVPLILLLLGLTFTQLRKDVLWGATVAYYLLYFFLPPVFSAVKKLFYRTRHWFVFRCPYCKSRELILQGMQEFHGDIPYDHYFCNRCRDTSVLVDEKMIAPIPSKLKGAQKAISNSAFKP
jgi:hypothetical protein